MTFDLQSESNSRVKKSQRSENTGKRVHEDWIKSVSSIHFYMITFDAGTPSQQTRILDGDDHTESLTKLTRCHQGDRFYL